MSANESQNHSSIITSNIISPPSSQTNLDESKSFNNEVNDEVQKIQQLSKDEDEEGLSDLANGGWEDDFTDNEDDDAESMKEWETLEFLCQISKTRSNKNNSCEDGNGEVENGKNDSSIDSLEKSGENNDGDDNGSGDSTVERNGVEKKIESSKNSEIKPNNDKITSSLIPTFPNEIEPLANNIKQLSLPHHQLNSENRKRRALKNDDEIDLAILFQKTKKLKDDGLEIPKNSNDL